MDSDPEYGDRGPAPPPLGEPNSKKYHPIIDGKLSIFLVSNFLILIN